MPTKVETRKDELYGNEIRDRLFAFAEEGWDAIPDEEHDAWFARFKWRGPYHQRKGQESHFVLRTGTPNGVVEPGQFEAIAEVADEFACGPEENPEFGDAYCDWTTRQSIQLHWIKLEDVPAIFEKLESVGLSTQQGLWRLLAQHRRLSGRRQRRTRARRRLAGRGRTPRDVRGQRRLRHPPAHVDGVGHRL